MVTSEQVVQQVSLQVDAIEPVHRLAQPRKPHDEGGGVDVLASATRGGSRLSHAWRGPRHGSRPLLPFGRFVLDAPAAHLSPRRNRPSPLAKPAAAPRFSNGKPARQALGTTIARLIANSVKHEADVVSNTVTMTSGSFGVVPSSTLVWPCG